MYSILKGILKSILPKKFLEKYDPVFRKLYASFFFRGNKHGCNICENTFSKFIEIQTGERMCPFCGSLPRNRLLWKILTSRIKLKGKLLHFSPARPLYRKLKNLDAIEYTSSDFENEFSAEKNHDITNIGEPPNAFDHIICFHVLEHIEEDRKAMRELHRVLKPSGCALIQTPFKEGDIFEDLSITSKEKRKKFFGQEDHVRIYSVAGLKRRLEKAGFVVAVEKYREKDRDNYWGFKSEETVLFAKK